MATPPVIIIIGGHAYHFSSIKEMAEFAQRVNTGMPAEFAYGESTK